MKQSSIDFIAEELDKAIKGFLQNVTTHDLVVAREALNLGTNYANAVIAARKMHRQEIEEAYNDGFKEGENCGIGNTSKNYYEETFKQK